MLKVDSSSGGITLSKERETSKNWAKLGRKKGFETFSQYRVRE